MDDNKENLADVPSEEFGKIGSNIIQYTKQGA